MFLSLQAVIHVSTAYSNCHLQEIHEKLYRYPLTHQKVTAVVESVNDKMLDVIAPQ
jgi:hypothetical protein